MELNRQAILNGTPSKMIKSAYEKLRANYSKSGSFEFYNLYKPQDLLTIYNNSRYIFAEPYRGLGFFTHAVTSVQHLDRIMVEYTKLLDYFAENKDQMDEDQKLQYQDSLNYIQEYITDLEPVLALKAMLQVDSDNYDNETLNSDACIVDELYSYLYKLDDMCRPDDDESEEYDYIISQMDELLFQIDNLCYLPDILNIFTRTFDLSVSLFKYLKGVYTSNPTTLEDYCRDIYVSNIFKRIIASTKMRRHMEYCAHEQLRLKMMEITYTPDETLIAKLKEKTVSSDDVVYAGTQNAVNDIFFGEDLNDSLYKDQNEDIKQNITATESAMLSIVSDFMTYDLITEGAESDINIENGLLQFYNESEGTDYQQFNLKSQVNDIISNKALAIYEDGIDFNHKDNKPSATLKNDSVKDNDDSDSADKKSKPVKPKMSLNRKIQEKAIDANIAANKKGATMKKAKQEVRNTATALGKIPAGIINAAKNTIESWDKMDDAKRKEYISKPGNRKKVFRVLRIGLTYYVTAITTPLLTIAYFIYRSFSKEKDIRIRNELCHELEAEIKICEEKANDANSQGDNKKKYELIRIKDKLEAELVRVRANSSYI